MSHQQSDLTGIIVDRPFTPDLRGFIAWLETQDPSDAYRWQSPSTCVFARFHRAIGIPTVTTFCNWGDDPGLHSMYPNAQHIATGQPQTLGGAMVRARAVLAP